MKKILIIQTAYIGDVILATALVETLHSKYPEAQIDFVVRKGNENLLENHPLIGRIIVWNKKEKKYRNLFSVIRQIRTAHYDLLINLQRYASSGFMAYRAKAVIKSGFAQNPFAFCYHHKIKHVIGGGKHEIQRNHELIPDYEKIELKYPKLYPGKEELNEIESLRLAAGDYVCFAPSSVWFTKQLPKDKWVELAKICSNKNNIYFLGAKNDIDLCDEIIHLSQNKNCHNLCGQLSLKASALLMSKAVMNYVNDSGPLHLATAMNAPVTAFFCSTVPEFGFGPLSAKSKIIQVEEKLDCRPCGLHGFKECPKGHFKCGNQISILP